ncbi:MAG TPA: O-antigen ligase family protein [Methylibium sp.]|uniref:O-antigen ligase family protein n=1 Tax=Methylibium sp. TaxID=2067992 RepID=UPI002DBB530E|nr:O-antigen ligase family protein [Methylibium sp.]HEU4459284.1 O-antigen ligase family protein [Methylibium sp.]
MVTNLKALVVVLVLAGMTFHLAKPLALRFMTEELFKQRRNLWLLLTVAAFASPSFWIYAPIAAILVVKAARHEPNPVALFVLAATAVPPVMLAIPTIGIGALFDLSHQRLLALVLLLPVALQLWNKPRPGEHAGALRAIDIGVAGYLLVQMVVLLPHDSVTNILRRGLHFVLDYGLVYYVLSRAVTTRAALFETMACMVLSCAVLVLPSLFETMRSWLLYQGLGELWGKPDPFAWLFRGDSLRAQTSLGHSITFGFHMAIAFGMTLALARAIGSSKTAWVVGAWMWLGLIAAFSRAPWLAAGMAAVVCAALAPGGAANVKRLLMLAMVGGGLLMASPWGDDIMDVMPFIGTVDSTNVVYRQQLAATSWNLILKNPILGDPLVLRDMESLRQGQGIIDLVNAYASVALFNGLVGLTLFVMPLVVASFTAWRISQAKRDAELSDTLLGAALVASMMATLLHIATAGYDWLLWALLGLTTAYIALDRREVTPITPLSRRAPLPARAVMQTQGRARRAH